jgi:hypothetical protein
VLRPMGEAIHEIVTPLSTGYTCPVIIRDSSEARDARRHLFRLWLDAPIRPVHPYIRSRGILPVAGRTPSFDWSSITAVRH